MKPLFAVLFVLLALSAQAQTTYRDWAGREIGSSTTVGSTTVYRDRMGRDQLAAIKGYDWLKQHNPYDV